MSFLVSVGMGVCLVLFGAGLVSLLRAIFSNRHRLSALQAIVVFIMTALTGFILLAIAVNWGHLLGAWTLLGLIIGAAVWWKYMVDDLELPFEGSNIFDT